MIIKRLENKDIEVASQLYSDSFNRPYRRIEVDDKDIVLGLYLEDELIGLVQINYINNVFEDKKIGYLNSFCIKEEYRHQGYGDKLLKYCEKLIKENGCNTIQMTSNKNRVYAHMLYKKNS